MTETWKEAALDAYEEDERERKQLLEERAGLDIHKGMTVLLAWLMDRQGASASFHVKPNPNPEIGTFFVDGFEFAYDYDDLRDRDFLRMRKGEGLARGLTSWTPVYNLVDIGKVITETKGEYDD